MNRTVECIKLRERLSGLPYPPMRGELGLRIFNHISEDAWAMWLKHSTMVINEYRINPTKAEDRHILRNQLEMFLFGEGAEPPPDHVPAS